MPRPHVFEPHVFEPHEQLSQLCNRLLSRLQEKFVATRKVDIVAEMMGIYYLSVMIIPYYYRNFPVFNRLVSHKNVPALAKSLNGDVSGSKIPSISHFDNLWLHIVTTRNFSLLFRAASNFMNNPTKPALFNTPTFYTRSRWF